jgi:spore coat polysaccharide biosynthesis predicted glycosyltransferase SpsG
MIMGNAKTVLIRADGSKRIGMGHLIRARLVSDMLEARFGMTAKLIMKDEETAKGFTGTRVMDTVLLPADISMEQEIAAIRKTIKDEVPSLFVLDVLEHDRDRSYTEAIREEGCPLVAITDDSQRRIINADLIVNGNPSQIDRDYSGESGKYLRGPMYFLMDPAYGETEVKAPGEKATKLFLTFGGSDHNDLLFRVLDALKDPRKDLSVVIVTSRSTGYLDRLRGYLKGYPLPHEIFMDVESLAPLWRKCDLAITAAGNTLFERIAVRMPGVTLCQLDRQMEIAGSFEALDVNVNLGFGPAINEKELREGIMDFIDDEEAKLRQYEKAPAVIDGKGMTRFGDEIGSLLEGC